MNMSDLFNIGKLPKYLRDIKGLNNKQNVILPKMEVFSPQIPIPKIRSAEYYKAIKEEREKINLLVTEIYYNIEKVNYFKNSIKLNTEYSSLITVSIIFSIFLIVTCIALPLLILPLNYNPNFQQMIELLKDNISSLKGIFVTLVTFLICSIFIIFAIKNEKMKYTKDDIN